MRTVSTRFFYELYRRGRRGSDLCQDVGGLSFEHRLSLDSRRNTTWGSSNSHPGKA
jgi:hypothetical protein